MTCWKVGLFWNGNGGTEIPLAPTQRFMSKQLACAFAEQGPCAGNAQASCFDMNRWVSASAIAVAPFPFQNRPTFQQEVELTRTLPR